MRVVLFPSMVGMFLAVLWFSGGGKNGYAAERKENPASVGMVAAEKIKCKINN